MSERQEYMEPVHYFASSVSTKLDRLRAGVAEAEAEARRQTNWVERTRAEQHAKSLARELQSAEFNAKMAQGGSRQQAAQQAAGPLVVCKASDPGAQLVPSACGTRYLAMRRPPLSATQQAAASPATQQEQEQQFAETQPYYETAKT